mmetsp:Transcript_5957/g.15166  ORF Transcript_5957/g.15166 Transcript_5957/m.15166 type:complete len:511 (-) Transcript_5957:431-1963(-)
MTEVEKTTRSSSDNNSSHSSHSSHDLGPAANSGKPTEATASTGRAPTCSRSGSGSTTNSVHDEAGEQSSPGTQLDPKPGPAEAPVKDPKDAKDAKETKSEKSETKETKDPKDAKEAKDAKDQKDAPLQSASSAGKGGRSGRQGGGRGTRDKSGNSSGSGFPWDMESLKEAILAAEAGSGDVRNLIVKSGFSPRAPAFTALINVCGKEKMADKALEVFEAATHMPNVQRNTYMYSALISALGGSGMWEKALEVFDNMKQDAAGPRGPICEPNTITYSALISACERAGKLERAWEVYQEMRESNVMPDLITYSVLLSACEKENEWDKALEVVDAMHSAGMHANQLSYSRAINSLAEQGRVEKATEVFLQMQMCGCEANLHLCNTMLTCLERNGRGDLAFHLLRSMHENGIVGESGTYNATLAAILGTRWPSSQGAHNPNAILSTMLDVYQMMKFFGVRVTPYTCRLLIDACVAARQTPAALALAHEFQHGLSVSMEEETLEKLNSLLRDENV